jgi:hypothetical protein
MNKINPAYLEALHKRCPHVGGSGKWAAWICAEVEKLANIYDKVVALKRKEEDENRRHKVEIQSITNAIVSLQEACAHESTTQHPRPCAEADSRTTCDVCQKEI